MIVLFQSNAKLDLTEQLQAERNIGRKLNAKLNTVEIEMDNLKEKLREKETFLIELEKEKLQNAQIADQIQHYQAQSHHAHTLQQELQNALVISEVSITFSFLLENCLYVNFI